MRILVIIFTFLTYAVIGQTTKIKIKKAEPEYKVTLAGLDTGTVTLDKLLAEKKLFITNNILKLKIYSYTAFISLGENTTSMGYYGKNEIISKDLFDDIEQRIKTQDIEVHFEKIQAYNSFNETINLNSIVLKVIK